MLSYLECAVRYCLNVDISEEHTASIVRVIKLVEANAKVIQTKKCVGYIQWVEECLTNDSYRMQDEGETILLSQWELQIRKNCLFQASLVGHVEIIWTMTVV